MSEKKGFAAMLKLGVVLALYAAAACVGLAFVYAGTKDKIETNQKAVMEEALRELFPGAEFSAAAGLSIADPLVSIVADRNDPQNTGVFAATQNGVLAGLALKISRNGFGGPVVLLVGVGTDGRIKGVKILEHSETPGLGANAASPNYFVNKAQGITFYGQFAGKAVSDDFAVKQDVDAITASTITSKAVSDSVKAAGIAAAEWIKNNGGPR